MLCVFCLYSTILLGVHVDSTREAYSYSLGDGNAIKPLTEKTSKPLIFEMTLIAN